MPVRVELFGIPRQRAGVESIRVEARSLGDVVDRLSSLFPRLAETCFEAGEFKAGYVANVNGRIFVTDRAVRLADDDSVLILSSDAGG